MTDCPHPLCHMTLEGGQIVCPGHLGWWRRSKRQSRKPAEGELKQSKVTLTGSIEDQLMWWRNVLYRQEQSSQDSDKAPSAMSKNDEIP